MEADKAINLLEEIKKWHKINPVSEWGQALNTAIVLLEAKKDKRLIYADELILRLQKSGLLKMDGLADNVEMIAVQSIIDDMCDDMCNGGSGWEIVK